MGRIVLKKGNMMSHKIIKMPIDTFVDSLLEKIDLTDVEIEMTMYLIQTSLRVADIADELGIEFESFKKMQTKMYKKLGVHTRIELTVSYIHFLEDSI